MPSMCQTALCLALYIYYLSLLRSPGKLNTSSCRLINVRTKILTPKPMFSPHYVMLSSYMWVLSCPFHLLVGSCFSRFLSLNGYSENGSYEPLSLLCFSWKGKISLGQCFFGFKTQSQTKTTYGPSLHRMPNGYKISVLIFKATICSYNVFVLIRNMCHLGADNLQRSVHSSGTRRKILFFFGNVGTSSGQLNEFQPPLVPFQFSNLIQGATCPVQ